MKTLQFKTETYDKARKIFHIFYGITLTAGIIYLFLILTSSGEFMSFKTLATILITFIVGSVIPYSTLRIFNNALHRDKNNALVEYSQKLENKYNVVFDKPNRIYINQAAVFRDKNSGKRFWGVATLEEDSQTPLLKIIEDYSPTLVKDEN